MGGMHPFLSSKEASEMAKREIKRILVTGAVGQIGSELTMALRERYGNDRVVASDLKSSLTEKLLESGPFEWMDVTDPKRMAEVCRKYKIDAVVHLAAILSATGEKNPALCWNVNINGLLHCLEIARDLELARVLCPSSIAVFGPGCPLQDTPQETVLRPTTMYGVTKVAGELLCDYFVNRFHVDARGLRYPGIISAETLPGGGTTDYAVEIFYKAVEKGAYECFVREDTRLPMMYMPDCLKATVDLLEAPFESLKHHSDFNVASMSFSAGELAAEIRKHIPSFKVNYKPDFHQAIADSWPQSIDDSAAREEWGWRPSHDLSSMTADMLAKLRKRHEEKKLYR